MSLLISNDFISSNIYDNRDNFDFDIVSFPFLDNDIPRVPSYSVYISQLLRFARVSGHLSDFNAPYKFSLPNFSNRGIGTIKFGKFYRRH